MVARLTPKSTRYAYGDRFSAKMPIVPESVPFTLAYLSAVFEQLRPFFLSRIED